MFRIILLMLLTVSLLANFYFLSQQTQQGAAQEDLAYKYQVVKGDYDLMKQAYKREKDNMAGIRQAHNRLIRLEGTPAFANTYALVFWETQKHTVFLDANGLPSPPGGKQYQAWQIVDGGKYESLGVFNYQPDKDNLFQVRNAKQPKGFAISLELTQGAKQPTSNQIYVEGAF